MQTCLQRRQMKVVPSPWSRLLLILRLQVSRKFKDSKFSGQLNDVGRNQPCWRAERSMAGDIVPEANSEVYPRLHYHIKMVGSHINVHSSVSNYQQSIKIRHY